MKGFSADAHIYSIIAGDKIGVVPGRMDTMRTIKCVNCGDPHETKSRTAKYCDKCRNPVDRKQRKESRERVAKRKGKR